MRLFIAAVLLVSLPAVADPARPASTKQMHADDCAKARAANRACVIDMTGEQVDGQGVVPKGMASTAITFTQHGSLIHVRQDFIEQVLKTAQEL